MSDVLDDKLMYLNCLVCPKRKFVTWKNFNIYIVFGNFIVTANCHTWCLDVTELFMKFPFTFTSLRLQPKVSKSQIS